MGTFRRECICSATYVSTTLGLTTRRWSTAATESHQRASCSSICCIDCAMSGPELTRQLVEQRPALRVIYMSGTRRTPLSSMGCSHPAIAFRISHSILKHSEPKTQRSRMFANQAAARMVGMSPDSLVGAHLHGLTHHTRADGRAYPAGDCRIMQALRKGEPVHADDEMFWREDETSLPVEYWARPFSEQGVVAGSVITFFDLTDRKRLEAESRKAVDEYQELFDRATDLVGSIGADGRIRFVNRAWGEAMGWDEDETVGRSVLDVLDPANHDSYRDLLSKAFAGQPLGTIAVTFISKANGRSRPKTLSYQVTDGRVTAVRGIFRDVTERNRLEAATRHSQRRFHAIAETITDVFWMTSLDMRAVEYVSPAYETVWGRSRANLAANPSDWFDAIVPEDRANVSVRVREPRHHDSDAGHRIPDCPTRCDRPLGRSERRSVARLRRHAVEQGGDRHRHHRSEA